MTIKGDPDALMKVAHSVLAEPYAYIERAKSTVDGPCRLPALAFGIAPSFTLAGPYDDARSAVAKATDDGAAAVKSMAVGFANVAHAMGGADLANTLAPTKPPLPKPDIRPDGSDAASAQSAVFGVEVMLLAEWMATGGTLAACGALAPAALASIATWALVEPDDSALSQAISAWLSAGKDVDSASRYLDLALGPLDQGWPDEDTSRQDFDRWKIPFDQDFDLLKAAPDTVADALTEAVNQVHEVQTDAFIIAAGSLAAILVLTALDAVPFVDIGAEAVKEAIGIALDIEMGASVLAVVGICKGLFDAMKTLLQSGDGFELSKPGQQKVPNFKELPHINWTAPYPAGRP